MLGESISLMLKRRTLTARPNNILDYNLDFSNPLTPKYGFYVFQNGRAYNLVNEELQHSYGAGVYIGSSDLGFYAGYNGATTAHIRMPSSTAAGQYWNVSILASQTFIYNSTEQAILCLTDGSQNRLLQFYADWYSNQLRLSAWAGSDRSTATGSISDSQNYIVGLVAEAKSSGVNVVQLYIDGALELDQGSSYSKFEDATRIYLGNTDTNDNKAANGRQYWVYLDNTRLLRPDEMESLSDNVWQIFIPRPKVFYGATIKFRSAWVRNNMLTGGGKVA